MRRRKSLRCLVPIQHRPIHRGNSSLYVLSQQTAHVGKEEEKKEETLQISISAKLLVRFHLRGMEWNGMMRKERE